MPANRYKCECGEEWGFIGPYKERPCPACQKLVKPLLPGEVAPPSVFETVDKERGIKWRDNFQERAEKRNKFYNKKTAKERAREHGDPLEKHGITEDDPRLI